MTPAGIEPATFRFVAQHFNHCATAVLSTHIKYKSVQLKRKHRLGDPIEDWKTIPNLSLKGMGYQAVDWIQMAKSWEEEWVVVEC